MAGTGGLRLPPGAPTTGGGRGGTTLQDADAAAVTPAGAEDEFSNWRPYFDPRGSSFFPFRDQGWFEGEATQANTLAESLFSGREADLQRWQGREAPTLDQTQVNQLALYNMGARQDMQNAALGAAGLANGQDVNAQRFYGGAQGNLAFGADPRSIEALYALGQMPTGPSAAELAMQRQAAEGNAAISSMVSGARGSDTAMALREGLSQQSRLAGDLTRDIGVQRATEDLANRQFAANALGMAGDQQMNMLGQRGQLLGQAASTYGAAQQGALGAYGTAGDLANQVRAGDLSLGQQYQDAAGANLNAQLQQRGANDAMSQWNMGQTDAMSQYFWGREGQMAMSDAAAGAEYQNLQTNAWLQDFAIRAGQQPNNTITGSRLGDVVLGAGMTAGGAALGTLGGPAGTAGGAAAGQTAYQAVGSAVSDTGRGVSSSDIRAKTNIRDATAETDETFRALGSERYEYRDPQRYGRGEYVGPMAQDLEATPAGSTVVGRDERGMRNVDTGRLSMLTASEVANMRRELDALKAQTGRPLTRREADYPAVSANDYNATVPGNIDLSRRPQVRNADGSISTVRSMGVNIGGREVLIPTVSEDGRIMGDEEAIAEYERGGRHLGMYGSVADSNAAAEAIHNDQALALLGGYGGPPAARFADASQGQPPLRGGVSLADALAYEDELRRRAAQRPTYPTPAAPPVFR